MDHFPQLAEHVLIGGICGTRGALLQDSALHIHENTPGLIGPELNADRSPRFRAKGEGNGLSPIGADEGLPG